ncbi:MAG TPA: tRNA guanosine(34) transglycosylase Tgt [Ignavibacteria bacterium]|nr:tRNA guanosine(34) transglycosylase Tgt [Ignavibacteria bacterium]HRJ03631.1 tRNA guanosine(34) transglycosylase Tgt [Ignavibacteria bacterium]
MFFKVLSQDSNSKARVSEITTSHGTFQTPIFMPVGTQATVKAIEQRELVEIGAKIILGNTYHLYLRPGTDVLNKAGGLHKFMNWNKPILTDSGGFQVFSLSALRKISAEGAEFKSHLDGSSHMFTPEKVVNIQREIGSDIMMVLDECLENPAEYSKVESSVKLTSDWAKRSRDEFLKTAPLYGHDQFQFGIIQGSVYNELRKRSALDLAEMNFEGYAIGGLAVGEENSVMYDVVEFTEQFMPRDKPRYLMGVGTPEDLLNAIERGVDMFDCVMPTRNARNATMFTSRGKLRLRNLDNKFNFGVIDDEVSSYTSDNFTPSYLRHLFMCDEMLAAQLTTIHNLRFYLHLVERAREAILNNSFTEFKRSFLEKYNSGIKSV